MVFNREFFERAFEEERWGYALCEYEKVKYERQLDVMLTYAPQARRILEVGGGEGIFTAMLAQSFPQAQVVCVDISKVALGRAREKCGSHANVEFVEGDIVQMLEGGKLGVGDFDAVVLSEVLYYLFPRLACRLDVKHCLRDVASLTSGGILMTANGLNFVTSRVMGVYYRTLKSMRCQPEHAAQYSEWNAVRKKTITYEIRVFRAPVQKGST